MKHLHRTWFGVVIALAVAVCSGCGRPAADSAATKKQAGPSDTATANGSNSDTDEPSSFRGHTASIRFLTFSANGKRLLTGSSGEMIEPREGKPEPAPSADQSARVWDVATGREVARFDKHSAGVACGALSPDGTLAATADGRIVRVWSVAEDSKQVHELAESPAKIVALAFSSDGKRLAAAGEDKFIRLYEVESGSPQRAWDEPEAAIRGVIFSPDDRYLASVGGQGVRVWDLGREQISRAMDEASPIAARFSANSKKLFVLVPWKQAAASGNGKANPQEIGAMVFEWDVESGEVVTHEPVSANGVGQAALAPDGSKLLVAGGAANGHMLVSVYDIAEKKAKGTIEVAHAGAFSADGSVLMAVTPDGKKAAIAVADAARANGEPEERASDSNKRAVNTVRMYDLPD